MVEMTRPEFEALIDRQPHLASRLLKEVVKRLRASDNATIRTLQGKNRQLTKAYDELKAAQAQLIEKERMETELSLARRIQENSLPDELPQPEGWQVAVNWQPARTVSGDFYDVLCGPDDNLHLLIADVTGKGVPAAMVVATARTILHTFMAQNLSPGELLREANELLCDETPPGMFITCFYAVIEPRSGLIRFANAGHNLPYCLGQNGLRPMNARGMPLGALPGSVYDGEQAVVEPGEGLLLYSDGLVEAHDPQGEMFGNARLEKLLTGLASDEGALDVLLNSLGEFTGDTPEQEDDITLLWVSRTGES
jgi:serine phosphatase RsbU (regulator of sigma subunit)